MVGRRDLTGLLELWSQGLQVVASVPRALGGDTPVRHQLVVVTYVGVLVHAEGLDGRECLAALGRDCL